MIKKAFDILFSKEHELLRKQFIKFVIVGIINTSISFVTFFLLTKFFLINDKIANIISYIVGVINSFILNKLWTFESKIFSFKELLLFGFFFLISFGLQILTYTLLKDKLHIYIYFSYFLGMIVYTLTNFLLNKFITFKK